MSSTVSIDQLLAFDASDRRTTFPTPETAITFSTLAGNTRVDSYDGTKIITSCKEIEIMFEGSIQTTPDGHLPVCIQGIDDSSVTITVYVHNVLDRVIKGAIVHTAPPGCELLAPSSCSLHRRIYPTSASVVGVETLASGSQACIAYRLYGPPEHVTRCASRIVFRCAVPLCPFGQFDICDHESITYAKREAMGAYDLRLLGQLAVCRAFQRQHLAKGYVRAVTSLRPIANVFSLTYPDEPPILFVAADSSHAERGALHSLCVSLPDLGIKAVYPRLPIDNLLMRISVASPRVWLLLNANMGLSDFGPATSEMLLRSLRDCKFTIQMPRDFMVLVSPFARLVKGVVIEETSHSPSNMMSLLKCTCLTTLSLSSKLGLVFTISKTHFPHLINVSAGSGVMITHELAQQLKTIALPLASLVSSGIYELEAVTTLRITERMEQWLLHWIQSRRAENPQFLPQLANVAHMPKSRLYTWMDLLMAPRLTQFGVHELFEDARLLLHPLVRNCEILTISHLTIYDACLLEEYVRPSNVCNLCLETLPKAWRLDELRVVNLYRHPCVTSFQMAPIMAIINDAQAKGLSVERFIRGEEWAEEAVEETVMEELTKEAVEEAAEEAAAEEERIVKLLSMMDSGNVVFDDEDDEGWGVDEDEELWDLNEVTRNVPLLSNLEGALVCAHKTFSAIWPHDRMLLAFPIAKTVVNLSLSAETLTIDAVAFLANSICTLQLRAELLMNTPNVPRFACVSKLTIDVDDEWMLFDNTSYVTDYFPKLMQLSLATPWTTWKAVRNITEARARIRLFTKEVKQRARRNVTIKVFIEGPSMSQHLLKL
jgi:hypothetical protein